MLITEPRSPGGRLRFSNGIFFAPELIDVQPYNGLSLCQRSNTRSNAWAADRTGCYSRAGASDDGRALCFFYCRPLGYLRRYERESPAASLSCCCGYAARSGKYAAAVRQTDRQTDGRTGGLTSYSMRVSGKVSVGINHHLFTDW